MSGCTQGDAQWGLGGSSLPRSHPKGCSIRGASQGCPGPIQRSWVGARERIPGACSRRKGWYPSGASSALSHSPGGGCCGLHPASQHRAARERPLLLSAFLRGAGAGGRPVLALPRDPSTGKTHVPIAAGIGLYGGRWETSPALPFPPCSSPGSSPCRGCSGSEGMLNPQQFCL